MPCSDPISPPHVTYKMMYGFKDDLKKVRSGPFPSGDMEQMKKPSRASFANGVNPERFT